MLGELARRAADKGVRIAFENCAMDGNWASGDWNIAHNPDAWELMFDALPRDNIGLEWEPCHQLYYLIDPIPQLRTWVPKIFHVHGKDASVRWDVVREHGVRGKYAVRLPSHARLRRHQLDGRHQRTARSVAITGAIDIEGWHDPVYRGELEMTGQVARAELPQAVPRRRRRAQSGLRSRDCKPGGHAPPTRGRRAEETGRMMKLRSPWSGCSRARR